MSMPLPGLKRSFGFAARLSPPPSPGDTMTPTSPGLRFGRQVPPRRRSAGRRRLAGVTRARRTMRRPGRLSAGGPRHDDGALTVCSPPAAGGSHADCHTTTAAPILAGCR